ncbi:transposase [Acinetobacter johnsonii]|uniref:transposase n=1 Tax=Acinetobacter johnsonii TaxID=40214 RepID=UPI003D184944
MSWAGHIKNSFLYRQACKIGRAVFQWFLPQWKQQYGEEQILYIDESGINTNETAEYDWSKKGKRCHALKSGEYGTRLSMISAVRLNAAFRFIAPLIFQGSCDRSTFAGWLEYLLKSLPKDKMVNTKSIY